MQAKYGLITVRVLSPDICHVSEGLDEAKVLIENCEGRSLGLIKAGARVVKKRSVLFYETNEFGPHWGYL